MRHARCPSHEYEEVTDPVRIRRYFTDSMIWWLEAISVFSHVWLGLPSSCIIFPGGFGHPVEPTVLFEPCKAVPQKSGPTACSQDSGRLCC